MWIRFLTLHLRQVELSPADAVQRTQRSERPGRKGDGIGERPHLVGQCGVEGHLQAEHLHLPGQVLAAVLLVHVVAELLEREHAKLDQLPPPCHASTDVLGVAVEHRSKLVVEPDAPGSGAGVELALADDVVFQCKVLAGYEAAARLHAARNRAHRVDVKVAPGARRIDVPAGDALVHPERHVFQVRVHVGAVGEVGPGAAPGQGDAAVILPAEPADARVCPPGRTRLPRGEKVGVAPAQVLGQSGWRQPRYSGTAITMIAKSSRCWRMPSAVGHQPVEVGHGAVYRIDGEPVLRHQPVPLEVEDSRRSASQGVGEGAENAAR